MITDKEALWQMFGLIASYLMGYFSYWFIKWIERKQKKGAENDDTD